MHSLMAVDPGTSLNCFGNTCFFIPRGDFLDQGFTFKLTFNDNQELLYWYTNCLVGKNTLGKCIQKIMETGEIQSYYHNHSTCKSTCTHLFQKGGGSTTQKEQTGHESDVIMRYKKTKSRARKEGVRHIVILTKREAGN